MKRLPITEKENVSDIREGQIPMGDELSLRQRLAWPLCEPSSRHAPLHNQLSTAKRFFIQHPGNARTLGIVFSSDGSDPRHL